MNIGQYKASIDEIPVRKFEVGELKNNYIRINHTRKIIRHRLIPAFLILCLAICCIFLFPGLPNQDSDISITAYAAEQEAILSKDYIRFNLAANLMDGGTSIDDEGNNYNSYVNFNLNFLCEGKDLETLTYTCSEKNITRSNRSSASAYYVENLTVPLKEFGTQMKNNDSLYGYYGEGETTARITKLIGNSYSVTYDDQKKLPYGLVIAADVDENNNYRIKDIIIKLDITMKDGSVKHKRIKIEAAKDALSGIQIRIL